MAKTREIADKQKAKDNMRYFIIQRDLLSMYGNEIGSNKGEAEQLLGEASEVGDLVVIHGVIVKPYFNLK